MPRKAQNVEFVLTLQELSGLNSVSSFARACGKQTANMSSYLKGAKTPQTKVLKSCLTQRRDATLAFEQQHAFVNVVLDKPHGARNSIPSVRGVTNPELAIVRLHGRNEATWNLKDSTSASDRFKYDYSDEERAALAEPIQQFARSGSGCWP